MNCPWEFVEHHRPRLRSAWLAKSKLSTRMKMWVDDAISDASLRFVQKVNTTGVQRGAWKTYLEIAVRNAVIDRIRDESHAEVLSSDAQMCEDVTYQETSDFASIGLLSDIEILPLFYGILKHISPQYRKVLLTHMQGYESPEGSRKCGMTEPAYKNRLRRARKQVAQYLGYAWRN